MEESVRTETAQGSPLSGHGLGFLRVVPHFSKLGAVRDEEQKGAEEGRRWGGGSSDPREEGTHLGRTPSHERSERC